MATQRRGTRGKGETCNDLQGRQKHTYSVIPCSIWCKLSHALDMISLVAGLSVPEINNQPFLRFTHTRRFLLIRKRGKPLWKCARAFQDRFGSWCYILMLLGFFFLFWMKGRSNVINEEVIIHQNWGCFRLLKTEKNSIECRQFEQHLHNVLPNRIALVCVWLMMASSNGSIFRVTGHLCGEFNGHRWIPRTKTSDAELWCIL